jgi:predicted PurR-regulated permease PerM
MGAKAWTTLGGYLRGVAVLGTFEGIVLGITITVVGGALAIPVAIVTFLASFVPIVGAVVAGVVAVLVALATAGVGPAVIVAVVAIVVQQLDNDLLSPVVYGHTLELHPLVVLFSIVAGGALFGIAGTILAVPLTAMAVNVLAEARATEAAEAPVAAEDGAGA